MLSRDRVGRTLCSSDPHLKCTFGLSLATPQHEFTFIFKEGGQDTYRRVFTAPLLIKPRTPQATSHCRPAPRG